jgi:hypothetical protein
LLQLCLKKLMSNGRFGAIALRLPEPFVTTFVLELYTPKGTVTTGDPIKAGKLGLNSVGTKRASREWFFSAPLTHGGPARYRFME